MLAKFSPDWLKDVALGVLITLVIAVPCGLLGYARGASVTVDQAEAKAARLAKVHATALAHATAAAWEAERAHLARAQAAESRLAQARSTHAREASSLKQEISRVTTQYRTALDAALTDRPGDVFTVGFVRLYNAALGAGGGLAMPADELAGRPAAPPDPADALDSGVRQADLLAHITDAGERCRGLDAQLNAVIDVIEAQREAQP